VEADPLTVPALEGERMPMRADGQDWWVWWHGPDETPPGTPHGAAGVCVGPGDELVLISPDGRRWGLPAGRPEGDETHEETLRRELREEACVEVLDARLLGYSRGECVRGHERGLVLVRSFWRAEVRIDPWEPEFEIEHRRLVPSSVATHYVLGPGGAVDRVHLRALVEAGLVADET
jgi:ADP-ribose pyrophosphatase YjhB (NUDIX family)